jgi:diguanylate cyclase (GGDEF)-like protein/PAS domain S-box-containing protein
MVQRKTSGGVAGSLRDPQDERRSRRATALAIASLVFAAALATLLTAAALEVQAGANAYVTGEGHWSRARQALVHALYRYSLEGDPRDLARGREALLVPLGDRAARLALELPEPDREGAIAGFRAGRNAEADLGRLVWMHEYFSNAPFFQHAVAVWREAELHVLELQRIADRLEAHWRVPGAAATGPEVRAELDRISARLEPLEREFSDTLLRGSRLLRVALLLLSGASFLLMAGLVLGIYRLSLRRLRATETRFRTAFLQATVGMVKLDAQGRVLAANEELAAMLRRPPDELGRLRIPELFVPEDRDAERTPVLAEQWERLEAPIERRLLRRDGDAFWCRITPSSVNTGRRGERRVFLIVEDISESRRLGETLAYHATHDGLTGLINRREIERRLAAVVDEAQRGGERHTLCFLDLDHFKLVNDTSSHCAGDQLLRLLAATLPARLRERDWVGRLGGDEFAILFAHTPLAEAQALAEALNRSLDDTSLLWEGRHFSLTSSCGLVQIDADTPSVGWLLRSADAACYSAKDAGGNRVRVYTELDQEIARRHGEMAWANQTRAAIAEGRLRLHAQRIVPLRDDGGGGLQYEVLVRMLDTTGGLCAPGAFLAAAERFMLATELDRRVLRMTLDLLAKHPAHVQQLELCHVNVSGQSAASAEFRAYAEACIDASPVPAAKLCFELTETASIGRLGEARSFIESMRARGCRIALDDFGSGLSSFAYLKGLPVDILKIDGLFVRDIAEDPLDRAVVRAVTDVARSLGKRTIAEWAESVDVLDRLRELGVDAAQGFAIHRPCPIEELLEGPRGDRVRASASAAPAADPSRRAG